MERRSEGSQHGVLLERLLRRQQVLPTSDPRGRERPVALRVEVSYDKNAHLLTGMGVSFLA